MYYKFPSDKRTACVFCRDGMPPFRFDRNARHVARVPDVAMEARSLMLASDDLPAPQGTSRRDNPTGIARRYLHDEVAERMRELIISGELGPKTRVNELELAQRFGISRTP